MVDRRGQEIEATVSFDLIGNCGNYILYFLPDVQGTFSVNKWYWIEYYVLLRWEFKHPVNTG